MQKELDHDQITRLAYQFWLERGCPIGSPEEDWFRAEEELRPEALSSVGAVATEPDTSR